MNINNPGEASYLALLRRVLDSGKEVPTRNGNRLTVIGETLKFSLSNCVLPLMTSRRLPFTAIVNKLDWFLSGSTNIDALHATNCHIWDKWALSQSDVDTELQRIASVASHQVSTYKKKIQGMVDSIGPMYGATWRTPLLNGEDQFTRLIRELKAHPYSTQHILTTYNLHVKMDETQSCAANIMMGNGALTPCHGLHTQFICLPPATPQGKPQLHCIFTNRSQDLPIGTAFNIATYGLLTHLVAHLCGFEAVELTWVGAHCHIYPDQIPAVTELVTRTPYTFPQVFFSPALTDIDQPSPVASHVTLVNYIAHEPMRIPVTG